MPTRKLITFDWAMKRLLRSKANFEILEGFLSELLSDDIVILEILESESNKESTADKFNRVDLKVKNSNGEIIIIEVQYEREFEVFSLLNLPEKDRLAYARYQDDLRYQASLIESNYGLGRLEGREEAKIEVGCRLVDKGMSVEEAAEIAGVDIDRLQQSSMTKK